MTDELATRIHIKHNEVCRKGIRPCLIVLGRRELPLLEGQTTFMLCIILIDTDSPSRCDVYGKEKLKGSW